MHRPFPCLLLVECTICTVADYHFRPSPGFRFIFLDGYDFSVLNPSAPAAAAEADAMLQGKNKNIALAGADWFAGIPITERRWVFQSVLIIIIIISSFSHPRWLASSRPDVWLT